MTIGLVKGRHEMPVDRYVFEQIEDVFNFDGMYSHAVEVLRGIAHVDLYVTGLTAAVAAVIRACHRCGCELVLWHYDVSTGEYRPQSILEKGGEE